VPLEASPDLDLVRSVRAGDRGAESQFIERMACVARYLAALNRSWGVRLSAADIEDLQQDVYMLVLASLPTFSGGAKLESWVFPICVRVLIKRLRARDREGQACDADRTAVVAREPWSLDTGQEIETYLRHLSPRQREVVRLHDVYGYSFEEIARELGISVNTAKTHRARAVEELRSILPPDERQDRQVHGT
jgi:RNA polymerase sigma-70 factor (ECF subfamily)